MAARPKQWSKSAFVLVGPLYGLSDLAAQGRETVEILLTALLAALAFALASSACYIFNDLMDREAIDTTPANAVARSPAARSPPASPASTASACSSRPPSSRC